MIACICGGILEIPVILGLTFVVSWIVHRVAGRRCCAHCPKEK